MKTKNLNFLLFVGTVMTFFLTSCATIYESKDFSSYKKEHKTLAILPFEVSIDRENLPKKVTADMVKEQEQQEGNLFQNSMYTFLLKEQSIDGYSVSFQDIDKTNVLLSKAGVTQENMYKFKKEELAAICGVDAVMSGEIHSKKKTSEGIAIATGAVFGLAMGVAWSSIFGSDYYYDDYYYNNGYYHYYNYNSYSATDIALGSAMGIIHGISVYQIMAGSIINMSISVHDGHTSDLIWNYDHRIGSVKGMSLANTSRRFIRTISRKLPYAIY